MMPTREQISALQTAAQDIIDGRDFASIRDSIEATVGTPADDWYGGRLFKMPVGAAFGHLIGVRTITYLTTESAPKSAADLPPYEKFLLHTQNLYQRAGDEVINQVPNSGQTLQDALQYYEKHATQVQIYEMKNPAKIRRRGKLPAVALTPGREILVRQVTGNATSTVPSTLVREALRISLAEGRLPESHELGQELTAKLGQLASPTTMSGQAFRQLSFGQELTKLHHKAFQSENPEEHLALPEWIDVLNLTVNTGTLSPYILQRAATLRSSLEGEHLQISTSRVLGHCAAQFLLRPPQSEQARNFFESQNVPLNGDAFKMSEYQLLQAISVAETTIFSDPEYRDALQLIAAEIRSQTE